MFVSNGQMAFDFHGYSKRAALLEHYWKGYQRKYNGWDGTVKRIDFPLLDRGALNARNHLGPDQYFGDAVERARRFIVQRACLNTIEPSLSISPIKGMV